MKSRLNKRHNQAKVIVGMQLALFTVLSTSCAATKDAAHYNKRIGRGVNMGNMLELPQSRARHKNIDKHYFELIREAGFNSVRIPVQWSHYTDEAAPYRIDEAFMKRVDGVVQAALDRKLVVILNVHHFSALMEQPKEQHRRFLAIWEQLAGRYRQYPSALYFEVLNEPSKNMTAEYWNRLQKEAVAVIRKSNPNRPVLIAPVGWNRIDKLSVMEPPKSGNLIASVHYYEPFRFTHQGASWVKMEQSVGVEWQGGEDERAAIAADMAAAAEWSGEHRIPIHVGEFGAYEKGDMASRCRWTKTVRQEAEKNGFSWSYWEFNAGFGVHDSKRSEWRDGLLNALMAD